MGWPWQVSENIMKPVVNPLCPLNAAACHEGRPNRSQLKVAGAPTNFIQFLGKFYSLFLCYLPVSLLEFTKMLAISTGPGTQLALNV